MRCRQLLYGLLFLIISLQAGCTPSIAQLKERCQETRNTSTCNEWAARLEKACDDEYNGWACLELAKGHMQGSPGMRADPQRTMMFLKKACERDEREACSIQRQIVEAITEQMANQMKEVIRKVDEAVVSCLRGSDIDTCTAVLSILGEGCKKKNQHMCEQMMPVARRSCDLGSADLCTLYATVAKSSCEEGNACGCGELGRLMVYPRPPVRPNRRMGIELLKAGCSKNCGDSCKILDELGVRH